MWHRSITAIGMGWWASEQKVGWRMEWMEPLRLFMSTRTPTAVLINDIRLYVIYNKLKIINDSPKWTLNKQINKKTKVNRWASPESLANLSESNKRCSDFFLSIFCTFVYKIMLESQDRTDWGSSQGSESRKAWPGQSQLKVLSNWNTILPQLWNRWYHTDYLNNFSTSQLISYI